MFIMGCDKSTDNDEPIIYSQAGPIPLAVANEWNYERGTRDSYLDSWEYDTITYKILKDTVISGHQWFGVLNEDGYQFWTNREDGLWAKSSATGNPYLLFKYPWDGSGEWPGEDSMYSIFPMYGMQRYFILPSMGVFFGYIYEARQWPIQTESIMYTACPGLGMAGKDIWHIEEVGYGRYRLKLIDCSLNPPPVDSSGSISFYLFINSDSLPDFPDFRVRFDIETIEYYHERVGLYHFEQPENPSNVVESFTSIIYVSYEPDSLPYMHFVRLPYILPGNDDLTIKIVTPDGGIGFSRTIIVDSVTVVADEDTFLGRIDVF
jgi:hypothetical protein